MRGAERRLRGAAAISGLVLVAAATVARVTERGPDGFGDRLVVVMIGMAVLCVTGLAFRRLPGVAWVTALFAALIGLTQALAVVRGPEDSSPPLPLLLGDVALVWAAFLACAFAWTASTRSPTERRLVRAPVAAAFAVVAVVFALDLAAIATTAASGGLLPQDVGHGPTRVGLAAVALGASIGSILALRTPLLRARARAAAAPRADGRRARLDRFLALLTDELLAPLRAATVAEARETERARLAADLHAIVLPDLRFAYAAAAAEGALPVAERLTEALADIGSMMASAHSPVLERYGLVAALEWLAERTEERSDVEVAIDVTSDVARSARAGGSAPERDRAPASVERAAFRVALLALDNVVRHAPGAHVDIAVENGPARVSLAISDDGPGMNELMLDGAALSGRRGIADMRTEAMECGARLTVGRPAVGRGATVRFDWIG